MVMQQFSNSLPMLLYGALDAVLPRFRKIFKEFGLTEQQWRVLRVLWESDEVPFHEVAEITRISAPSLVGVIDRLHKRDLVDRLRSDDDRRQVFLVATPKAKDMKQHVVPLVEAAYAEMRASIDSSVWDQVTAGLVDIAALEQPDAANSNEDSA